MRGQADTCATVFLAVQLTAIQQQRCWCYVVVWCAVDVVALAPLVFEGVLVAWCWVQPASMQCQVAR
jgi:hypothetical protein